MSELRGLLEKANAGHATVADVIRLADAAISHLPTLLDDLAAAQGEIERLREALGHEVANCPLCKGAVMTTNTFLHAISKSVDGVELAPVDCPRCKPARSALTLKSEKEGLEASRDLRPQPVASEPKNSDVQQVKP
jgi:hypothetical protein